jgi:hypothetical protein
MAMIPPMVKAVLMESSIRIKRKWKRCAEGEKEMRFRRVERTQVG